MKTYFPGIIFALLLTGCMAPAPSSSIRFVPVGDSYTIGTGISQDDAWPALLTKQLNEAGVGIELIENPARNGWTTGDVIHGELPVFDKLRPTFSTLLIGVNDWVQGVPADTFRKRLVEIMDHMQPYLPPNRLIILTIPDYTVTPAGSQLGDPGENLAGIRSFNAIIAEEASKRNLPVVDLFELSQGMGKDRSLVADDGLHPSEKEHQLWTDKIFPEALKLLN